MKAGWRKSRRTEIQRRRECSGCSSSSSHTQRQVLNLPPCLIKAGGVCGREHRHYTSQWKWNLSDGEMRMQSRVGKWWVWVSVTWERSQGHLTDKQTIEQRPESQWSKPYRWLGEEWSRETGNSEALGRNMFNRDGKEANGPEEGSWQETRTEVRMGCDYSVLRG